MHQHTVPMNIKHAQTPPLRVPRLTSVEWIVALEFHFLSPDNSRYIRVGFEPRTFRNEVERDTTGPTPAPTSNSFCLTYTKKNTLSRFILTFYI